MIRVGLTGGLASGKSFVGRALANLGGHLIQADELGHQVLLPGGEAYGPAVAEFGESILDEHRMIDRRKLGAIVFHDPEKLAKLSAIVHPAVGQEERRLIGEIVARDPEAVVVVEAAIMVETGSYKQYDRLVVVACSLEQQIERAMHRDRLSREDVMARLDRQLPLKEKERLADYVIDTSGTKEQTLEQTSELYASLKRVKSSKWKVD